MQDYFINEVTNPILFYKSEFKSLPIIGPMNEINNEVQQ